MKHKGKNHYFTKNQKESEALYLHWLNSVWVPAQEGKKPSTTKPLTVLDLSEMYLSWVYQNRSKKLFQDYRSYLRPLLAMCPTLPVSSLDTQVCEAMKQDMLGAGYKPASVNHSLKCVRRMVGWGCTTCVLEHRTLPHLTLVVGKERISPVLTSKQIDFLLQFPAKHQRLQEWLVLNYLTCARPSEIVRLAHKEGEWVERNVFRTRSKVGNRTGYDRFLLFSDEALRWVPKLEPRWSTHDSYGKAVRKLGMGGPRQLRKAGASHLRAAGVSYKDIRVILGHTEAGAVVHYVEEDFSTVLPFLSRLSVLPLSPD